VAGWNFGDLLEGIEGVLPPDAPALIHDTTTVGWGEAAQRSTSLAAGLASRSIAPNDKIAFYLRNGTAYMLTLAACLKGRFVHVNVNYRYLDDELHYILENSDATVVVFDAEFADRVERVRDRLPNVKVWLYAEPDGDGAASFSCPAFAESLNAVTREAPDAVLDVERSPDDLLFIYTGGTTGMPKGVMWRHEDLWGALGAGSNVRANRGEKPATPAEHIAKVAKHGAGPRQLVACPLMHGTGLLTAIGNFTGGGSTLTAGAASFNAASTFDFVERAQAESMVIVGDAFARPMLDALNAEPDRWNLSSLKVILSSGVMWSREIKEGLLDHYPTLALADLFGSSEAVGFGSAVTSRKAKAKGTTAKFSIGEDCRVFTEDHREVEPGSGERGFIARRGPIPVGYYKDEKKSAETFPTINGVRYSIPGDWCTVEADGTLTLLGRGSACINSAGEKIHPEEVEEALKLHGDVADALVVGVPDPKWGQAVTAVVELRSGCELDEASLRAHVRENLAPYKSPKRIFATPAAMFRAPNGKADYKSALRFALDELGVSA
jgi:acyl-CoA synthetase (AMP-forming)/AMP-acid ligase II